MKEIDPKKVRRMMREYDRIGEKKFFARYGGGRPKRYYVLSSDGSAYPSAVIAQAALGWEDINGGYGGNYSACTMLERAEFEILDMKDETQRLRKAYEQQVAEIGDAEHRAFVKTRIGQQLLRDELVRQRGICEITGISDLPLLRASHIKPWREANKKEKFDLNNAILLSALWDAAFDKGLLTFEDDGEPRYSEHLGKRVQKQFERSIRSTFWPSDKQCAYLAWHRENLFQQ